MRNWPHPRSRDGGIDEIPLPQPNGRLWLCGKHVVGPDPEIVLTQMGATTIVCLTQARELSDRFPEYVEWLRANLGDRALWLPIPDLDVPPLDDVHTLIAELRDRLDRDEQIIIHCAAGIGRTGTIATCLLVDMGYDLDEALRIVAAHRPMAGPEVGTQRDLVETYSAAIAAR